MNYLRLGKDNKKQIQQIAEVVEGGELIVFPFDTCYVFVADPTNQNAVDKLYQIKGRSINKAISVAVSDMKMACDYAKLTKENILIMQKLLPGPFTMVVEGKHKLAKGIEAQDGSLGIRIPDFKPVTELAKALGKPITATSANVSGQNICHNLDSLKKQLSIKKQKMVDLWVDGGQLAIRQASTVMDIRGSQIKTLRRGDVVMDKSGKGLLSSSELETKAIAHMIFNKVANTKNKKPLVFLLTGELGTGKTTFTKEIGRLLGIKEAITSPTFNIVNSYDLGSKNNDLRIRHFLHVDLYRIREEEELDQLDFLEMFDQKTLVCIEWPELMGKKYMNKLRKKAKCVSVWFEYGEKARERRVWFSS